jgi:hypothetical protein
VGADHKTVASYFEILEDTLLGVVVEPFHLSLRKRQLQSPKYFFFDPGIVRALTRMLSVPLKPKTYAYGKDYRFSYSNTKDGVEIDLIVELRLYLSSSTSLQIFSDFSVRQHIIWMGFTPRLHLVANAILVADQAVVLDPVPVQLPLIGESLNWTTGVPLAR